MLYHLCYRQIYHTYLTLGNELWHTQCLLTQHIVNCHSGSSAPRATGADLEQQVQSLTHTHSLTWCFSVTLNDYITTQNKLLSCLVVMSGVWVPGHERWCVPKFKCPEQKLIWHTHTVCLQLQEHLTHIRHLRQCQEHQSQLSDFLLSKHLQCPPEERNMDFPVKSYFILFYIIFEDQQVIFHCLHWIWIAYTDTRCRIHRCSEKVKDGGLRTKHVIFSYHLVLEVRSSKSVMQNFRLDCHGVMT
jgi:hypothetical protein